MPEMWFTVQWPDGSSDVCYSPSTAIRRHLDAGGAYPLEEFVERARRALTEAGDRVEAKYGHRCSSADDQLGQIERIADRLRDAGDTGVVKVIDIKAARD